MGNVQSFPPCNQRTGIDAPFLSAANWGSQGVHPRGNFEGFVRAASKQKWLEAHGIEHWTHFYTDYGVKLQKRFFDHFRKNANDDWKKQPRVQLQVRSAGSITYDALGDGATFISPPLETDTEITGPLAAKLFVSSSTGARLSNFKNELRGCGPFLHDDPRGRPAAVCGGKNTLHAGPDQEAYVLVLVIPARD
jgi:predicted acyl esterase